MSRSDYESNRSRRNAGSGTNRTNRSASRDTYRTSRSGGGQKETRRKKKGRKLPGVLITAALLVLMVVFCIMLAVTQMVPMRYMIAALVILFLLALLVGLLVANTAWRARFIIGTVLAVILAVVLVYGFFALHAAMSALNEITSTRMELTQVGVYVLEDDPAQTLNDAEDYTFGIMSDLDRVYVNHAIEQLNDHLETSVDIAEYSGLTDLFDALFDQECGAIIINTAYLDVIEDVEGYEDAGDRIRELDSFTVEEEVEVKESVRQEKNGNCFVLYLSGIDSRTGLVSKSRSDVNILAVANTDTHQLLLLNTPRDYYVPLSISNGQRDKLTHAGIYGVSVSMDTLSMLYDVDVDYYFRVNFEGFENIVDALGGVNVYSDYTFTATHGGYHYTKGYNYVNGAQALSFARERYAFSAGDIQRGKNQMYLIDAILDKVLSPSILSSYFDLMTSLSSSFETSMSYDLIASLVSDQLATGAEWNIVSYTVSGTGSKQIPYSMNAYAYVMVPDESTVAAAKTLINAVLDGETVTAPAS